MHIFMFVLRINGEYLRNYCVAVGVIVREPMLNKVYHVHGFLWGDTW